MSTVINNEEKKKWELINFCEFDKYASKSYCAIHNEDLSKNLGDINLVNEVQLKDFNMIVGGSPCQDFSVAGGLKGSYWMCDECGHTYNPLTVHWDVRHKCPMCSCEKIEKTRSSLLVEFLRIIRVKKPNFGMYENVKNIVGKQFINTTFKLFINELEEYGYNTYWEVLNSKDYGVPQNRERLYLVFIKKELDNGQFKFPRPFGCGVRLKDLIDDNVDEKFYISDERVEKLMEKAIGNKFCNKSAMFDPRDGMSSYAIGSQEFVRTGFTELCSTLAARDYKDPHCIVVDKDRTNRPILVGNVYGENFHTGYAGNVYDTGGISPTLRASSGGGVQPHIINKLNNIRIRKLTPKEYFKLQGFKEEEFLKAKNAGVSNTQLYKQAGNSIVVDVLYYIYKELYSAMPYLFDDLKLGSFFSGIGAFESALDRLYEDINLGDERLRITEE